ncbi:hypothetical protein M011DRAFT_526410 [Sporormia fimetaria CBS 119925]|uniref:2EXR domain-containing protein n=1 Tax=Sporormia fimetaria CBS 119925 TaxID=1340428 RepID=A0A6A6VBB7_9PLEO|nr:hypothetical protein M011DRAFT_526410 [Sporormia fimetaria CBS 119925]
MPFPVPAMTTFSHFPDLPYDLRSKIWRLALEPRIVTLTSCPELCAFRTRAEPTPEDCSRHVISRTRVPAILQTCREARISGLYERYLEHTHIFMKPYVSRLDDKITRRKWAREMRHGARKYDKETETKWIQTRGVYLNFDVDVVDIGEGELEWYQDIAQYVKRLRVHRGYLFWGFFLLQEDLSGFVNVEEVTYVDKNWERKIPMHLFHGVREGGRAYWDAHVGVLMHFLGRVLSGGIHQKKAHPERADNFDPISRTTALRRTMRTQLAKTQTRQEKRGNSNAEMNADVLTTTCLTWKGL